MKHTRPRRKPICLHRLMTLLFMIFAPFVDGTEFTGRGQSGPTGSLSGVVTDVNGAVLPGVTVTVRDPQTGLQRVVSTNGEGRWTVPALPVGDYEVTYEMAGFKKLVRERVSVEAAVPRTLEDRLEVGEVGAAITVTENASLLTPDTAATFRQLSAEELVRVPTSTRSFTHLLSAEAGVSADLPPVLNNSNGNISPSVNGTRTTSTSLFFNGIDATNITTNEGSLNDNIAPAPETLAEVKLQTSLYDASTGRSGGGNFQLVTRSGTNQFNGTVYYYLQHEKFNANDFFFNRDGIERPRARRHEGGFTIGGPIVKDRFFFFGGYQRTKAKTGFVPTASSITVLPEALRLIQGERTAEAVVAAFKQLNPNFPLTAQQISPVALRILNLRNPATGDFFIPAPRAGLQSTFRDQTVGQWVGGNPFVRQRNVFPAEFEQDQFTVRLDGQLTAANRLSGTFFFADFPGFDPFPDPSSLASPVTLQRNDRNRTLAVADTHVFGANLINEARFGFFYLNNTRQLDDPFLAITNEAVGVPNPATFFDNSPGTRRLGHYIWRNNLSNLSFGGPNDSFNRRKQQTFSFADNLTYVRGSHTLRVGGEFKRHQYDTNLPEEQATEFEKFENFTQFLAGFGTEADTQFGVTDKSFRFRDLSWFIADDWKINRQLTLNLGLRWDWFGWPEEKQGRIGNFDFDLLTNTENPVNGFIVPSNVQPTGYIVIDDAIAASTKVNNKHTLKGQDLNNFAPRFGFAYSPLDSSRLVIRGGYGIFYDRPSAAFINTVFSNYPFLREIEVTAPTRAVPLDRAFSQQFPNDPNFAFNRFLPNRIQLVRSGNVITYVIRDNTPVTRQADGTNNPIDIVTGQPSRGNIAETFEFRAIDRNLRTPYVQQWNLGVQFELTPNLLLEARYVGTKGTKLLQAVAFNQGYDLNDPATPEHIFRRFNEAYNAAYQAEVARTGNVNALRGPLRAAASERERGRGIAFGFPNPAAGLAVDYNLSDPNGSVIGFEARGPILGFNIPEALLLQSNGNSIYNAAQFSLTRRFVDGFQFNVAYTFAKSIDTSSVDPGSTAGSGKPDVPNTGFVVQGNQRDLASNRALSDFDRTHRFSASFVYDLPSFGSNSRLLTGWRLSGFLQFQSGTPFSLFASEPEASSAAQYTNLARGSGGLYRLGFGRPSLCGTLDQLRQSGPDRTEQYFNPAVLCSPLTPAGGYPANFGFGSLGRNVLRGPAQRRFDLGLSKNTQFTERVAVELRWDVFNVTNTANFANPNNDLQDGSDFGKILNTVGGPRVMQFGLRLKF